MFRFITDCVNSTAGLIAPMNDAAVDISRRTFLKKVDREQLRAIECQLGYSSHPKQGLTMARDFHVSYFRSKFGGRKCYFFRWSAIEYVFVEVSPYSGELPWFIANNAVVSRDRTGVGIRIVEGEPTK